MEDLFICITTKIEFTCMNSYRFPKNNMRFESIIITDGGVDFNDSLAVVFYFEKTDDGSIRCTTYPDNDDMEDIDVTEALNTPSNGYDYYKNSPFYSMVCNKYRFPDNDLGFKILEIPRLNHHSNFIRLHTDYNVIEIQFTQKTYYDKGNGVLELNSDLSRYLLGCRQ